jgi:DNA primase
MANLPRAKPDARVSAQWSWEELAVCDPADFTLWRAGPAFERLSPWRRCRV